MQATENCKKLKAAESWRNFFERSLLDAFKWARVRTDRQTDRQTERQTYRVHR